MNRRVICRVEPTAPYLVIGLMTLAIVAVATAPLWTDRAHYPWEQLDRRWIVGAGASIVLIPLMIRYVAVLRRTEGRGVWIENENLHVLGWHVPLREIEKLAVVRSRTPRVHAVLRDGSIKIISAWTMDIHEDDLVAEIERAVREANEGAPTSR